MIATGAAGTGSKPVAKPLAQAISDSVGAQAPFEGVTARVDFTNHLLDSSGASGGTDPLIGGGSGRLDAARAATEDSSDRVVRRVTRLLAQRLEIPLGILIGRIAWRESVLR